MESTQKVDMISIVKGNKAIYSYAIAGGIIHYDIVSGDTVYTVPIDKNDKNDIGDAKFEKEYPAITLMRYIRKSMETENPLLMLRISKLV